MLLAELLGQWLVGCLVRAEGPVLCMLFPQESRTGEALIEATFAPEDVPDARLYSRLKTTASGILRAILDEGDERSQNDRNAACQRDEQGTRALELTRLVGTPGLDVRIVVAATSSFASRASLFGNDAAGAAPHGATIAIALFISRASPRSAPANSCLNPSILLEDEPTTPPAESPQLVAVFPQRNSIVGLYEM